MYIIEIDWTAARISINSKVYLGIVFRCDKIPPGIETKYNNVIVKNGRIPQAPEIKHKAVFVSDKVIAI